ncbi:hypothetical protein GCM10009554_83420 [Kribbella koreensis]|uniref:HNH endonuclease n=1 Tax=Kribbella koreensis TaxID=57909 RepID=A0ABN1RTX0_9ACTN
MFPQDLDDYGARETLAALAEVHDLQGQADLAELRLALHFADLHPDPATLSGQVAMPGGERGVVYGGVGCPAVAEFAPAEFGAVTARSTGAAATFIGQALALRHRLPLTWAQVLSGHATAWKARKVASACMELSEEGAAIVDARVAAIVDTVTPLRLANIVKAAMWQADPEAAKARAEERARKRGVWAGRSDEYGTTMLFVRASSGDVIRFKATVDQCAEALAALGDTDSVQQRRARAFGILADPAQADQLLQVAHHLTASGMASRTNNDPPADAAAGPTAGTERTATADASGSATVDVSGSLDPVEPGDLDVEWDIDSGQRADDLNRFATDHPHDGAYAEDTPHPSDPAYDDYLPDSSDPINEPWSSNQADEVQDSDRGMDWAARRELAKKLEAIRQIAYTGRRPRQTVLYAHITDEVLLAGQGVARVEGYGPVFVDRLHELLGHDQVVIQPVIDLSVGVSVDAYEIPRRIRERVKLTYPVEQFPYGTAMTTDSIDLDHIEPFDPHGPPGQTSTANLVPLRRFSHRVKTHGGWTSRRLDERTVEWTTRNGFVFRVDHLGTHRVDDGE